MSGGLRVVLIVTGELEKKALHLSLARFFPGVTFEVLLRDGFTSCALPEEPLPGSGHASLVEKLAADLIHAVDPGRGGAPADLAILVDDLELYNAGDPERAVRHVQAAMKAKLRECWPSAERCRRAAELVRARCSFHLLSPMIEAYFFGEAAALTRAGARRAARFDPLERDLEAFTTEDPDYLAPPTGAGPVWATADRARHPKSYVRFLCDPDGRDRRAYRETRQGFDALRSLDWNAVLSPPAHAAFARAFLLDLADGLDHPEANRLFPGVPHPLTSQRRRDNVMRNV